MGHPLTEAEFPITRRIPPRGRYIGPDELAQSGIDRFRAAVRGHRLRTPINTLTGLRITDAGFGTLTCSMPASPWWQTGAGVSQRGRSLSLPTLPRRGASSPRPAHGWVRARRNFRWISSDPRRYAVGRSSLEDGSSTRRDRSGSPRSSFKTVAVACWHTAPPASSYSRSIPRTFPSGGSLVIRTSPEPSRTSSPSMAISAARSSSTQRRESRSFGNRSRRST